MNPGNIYATLPPQFQKMLRHAVILVMSLWLASGIIMAGVGIYVGYHLVPTQPVPALNCVTTEYVVSASSGDPDHHFVSYVLRCNN
jgi:hypothetical protein